MTLGWALSPVFDLEARSIVVVTGLESGSRRLQYNSVTV